MKTFTALYQKEYREHRSTLAIVLVVQVFVILLSRWLLREPEALIIPLLYLYAIYVTSTAASSYAKEEESGSARFLRMLPVGSGTILLAKLAWLGSVVLLLGFPFILGIGHPKGFFSGNFPGFVVYVAAILFCLASWGYFWTTRCPGRVYATLVSFCSLAILWSGVAWLALQHAIRYHGGILQPGPMMGMLVLLTFPFTLAGLWRAAGYFRHAEREPGSSTPFLNGPRRENDRKIRLVSRFFPAERWTPFQALLWQAICQSRDVLFLGLATAILFGLWQVFPAKTVYRICQDAQYLPESGANWPYYVQIFMISVYGFGIMIALGVASTIFSQDQDRGLYSQLGQRGVPARLVWWSRILPFLTVYLVPVPFLVLMGLQIYGGEADRHVLYPISVLILSYLAPFCFGSFYSLICRNVLSCKLLNFATCLTLLMAVGMTVQIPCFFVTDFYVYWAFGVMAVLVPLSFLIASRLYVVSWLREETSPRRFLLPVGTIVLAVCIAAAPLGYALLVEWFTDVQALVI